MSYFKQRIPVDVKARANGVKLDIPVGDETVSITIAPRADALRFSLRTRDPAETKIRYAIASAYVERVWQGLRRDRPMKLTHREATALAGEFYRALAEGAGKERTLGVEFTSQGPVAFTPSHEHEELIFPAALVDMARISEEDLETRLGPLADILLLRKGIAALDDESRRMLLQAIRKAAIDAFESRRRNAEGDYRPDPIAERFPRWADRMEPSPSPPSLPSIQSLKQLVEDWWRESEKAGLKPSTYDSYRSTFAALAAFLGHDDVSRVTPKDVVRFKDYRLAAINPRNGRPIAPKTVKDGDLTGLKSVFGWAVSNHRLVSNPAVGITVKLRRKTRLRSKGFTDEEATAILSAASHLQRTTETSQTFAAKRGVPWLCAYTGARVGEMAQLRKEDLRRAGERGGMPIWVLRLTPEAGKVKTDTARDVVLHPHLVEMGFVEFVEAASAGHLFVRPGKRGVLGPLKGLTNRLAEFSRSIVTRLAILQTQLILARPWHYSSQRTRSRLTKR